jgi:hypothetical protein
MNVEVVAFSTFCPLAQNFHYTRTLTAACDFLDKCIDARLKNREGSFKECTVTVERGRFSDLAK